MSFSSFGLPPALLTTLTELHYTAAYPIQEQGIPAILDRKDVLGIAPTGSGKTATYVLPLLANLQGATPLKNRHVQVLVMVPTRELAIQVEAVFKQFGNRLPERVKSMAIFGGASINPQMKGMMGVLVLVATPGRLLELVEANAVHISSISALVLDEADKMLNLGFRDEMDRVFAHLPRKRQNLLFSATLSKELSGLNRILLREPTVIKIQPKEEKVDLINQSAYAVTDDKKGPLLRQLIADNDWQQVLIFTSSIFKADSVTKKLRKNGIDAKATHSKKSQMARTNALSDFKSGKLRVLVATDLLGRGIDIEFLPYVVNYELPRSPKDYIHRIGRTGRAESPGQAITFVTPEDEHHFKVIQKKMGKQLPLIDIKTLGL